MVLTSRENLLSIAACLVAVAVVFHPIVFSGKTLSGVSLLPTVFTGGIYYPGASFDDLNGIEHPIPQTVTDPLGGIISDEPSPYIANRIYREGHLPWLNPWQGMGHPFAADLMSAVFYPLQLLPIAFPSSYTWDAYLLLRVVLFMWFLYLFLRKVGISRSGSFAGALCCGSSGYVVEWVNLFHLNVDLITPLLLLCLEGWLQDRKRKWLVVYAIAVAAAFAGGNPQPLLLMLPVATAYVPCRLLLPRGDLAELHPAFSNSRKALQVLSAVSAVPIMSLAGLMLCGFLLLPFVELYLESFHTHPVGTSRMIPSPGSRLFALFPALKVNEWGIAISERDKAGGTHHSLFGPGLAAAPLLLLSLLQARRFLPLIVPFATIYVLFIGKNCGVGSWAFLDRIPGVSGILLAKYTGVAIVAQSLLIAIGWDTVRRITGHKSAFLRTRILIAAAMILVTLAALIWLTYWYREYGPLAAGSPYYSRNVTLKRWYYGMAIVSLCTYLVVLLLPLRKRVPAHLFLMFPILLEGLMNTARPYAPRRETFAEPQFVKYLKQRHQEDDEFRSYAVGQILHPNLASGFGLEDFRIFDALVWRPYFDFVKHLVTGTNTSLYDHFTGSFNMDVIKNPMLDLCNVRYVISDKSPLSDMLAHRLPAAGKVTNSPGGPPGYTYTNVGARRRSSIYMVAPTMLRLDLKIENPREELRFYAGLDSCYNPVRWGDGAGVTVKVSDDHGLRRILFESFLPPPDGVSIRRWTAVSLKLGDYVGKSVHLDIQASAGKKGENTCDVLLIGDISLRSLDEENAEFPLAFQGELNVYRNPGCLPRAFVVSNMRTVASWDEMKVVTKDLGKAVTDTPVYFASAEADEALRTLKGQSSTSTSSSLTLLSRSLSKRMYEVRGDAASLLVISNLAYPGWKASIDGKSTHLLKAFGCLQSVLVPAGNHTVMLKYAPASVRLGTLLSGFAAIGMLFFLYWPAIRHRFATKAESAASNP